MDDVELLIVGAGLAGLCCAKAAAQSIFFHHRGLFWMRAGRDMVLSVCQ